MKKPTEFFLFISAFLLFIGCTNPQGEQANEQVDPAVEKAAIKAVHEQEMTTINNDNLEGYLATLDDNVEIFPEQVPMVKGKEGVKQWYESMGGEDFKLQTTPGEIILSGDHAFESYNWTFTGTISGSEEPMTDNRKGVRIYKRQADGSWKILWDIWNSDNPPPLPLPEPMDSVSADM